MLTVQDIQTKQFHVRFRGFDTGEVDEFLEQVAATLQAANFENSRLQEQVAAAERRVATFKEQEKASLDAILSAQRIVEEMKEKARDETDETLARTRREAREIEVNTARKISELELQIEQLQSIKTQARAELRKVLEAYLSRLNQDEAASADEALTPDLAVESAPVAEEATASNEDFDLEIEPSFELPAPAANPAETSQATAPAPAAPGDGEQASYLDGDMIFTLEDPLDIEERRGDELDDRMIDEIDVGELDLLEHDKTRGPEISLDEEDNPAKS